MKTSTIKKRRKEDKQHIRLGLAKQLAILSLIPALISVGFMTILILRELHARNQAKYVSSIVNYMTISSHLVHELQKERGVTSGYIGIKGKDMSAELKTQRLITDQKYFALEKHLESMDVEKYGQKFTIQLNAFSKKMLELHAVRREIKSLSITGKQSIAFYSETISRIISSFQEANLIIKDSELSFPFTACVNFVIGKEMAGVERAIITGIVAEDKPIGPSVMNKWLRVSNGQNVLFAAFEGQASKGIQKKFNNLLSRDNTKALEGIRKRLFEKHDEGNYGLILSDVYRITTKRINSLMAIEDTQLQEILQDADKISSEKTLSLIIYSVLTALSIIVIYTLCFWIVRGIKRQIKALSGAAKRIADGQLDYEIEITSRNEIGELAGNFNHMLHNLRQMKEKDKTNNWLKSGQAELNIKMQGADDITSLGRTIISYLATHLNAQVGVIYIAEEGCVLKLIGSYAYTKSENRAEEFKFGEGLVGQAAKEKKTILVTNVPDDYIKVNTGWGKAVPHNILVVPFLYKGVIKGVIELGSCNKFTDIQTDFLNIVAENIAAVFNLEQSRFRMREILEETGRKQV